MTDVPYAWVLVFMAGASMFGFAGNGARFVTSGGKPSHAIGMMFFGVLALVCLWVAWTVLRSPFRPDDREPLDVVAGTGPAVYAALSSLLSAR